MKFSIKDFFSKCDQIRIFHNGKLHFLCSVRKRIVICCYVVRRIFLNFLSKLDRIPTWNIKWNLVFCSLQLNCKMKFIFYKFVLPPCHFDWYQLQRVLYLFQYYLYLERKANSLLEIYLLRQKMNSNCCKTFPFT